MTLLREVFSCSTRRGILLFGSIIFLYNLAMGIVWPDLTRRWYGVEGTVPFPFLHPFLSWWQSLTGTVLASTVLIPLLLWVNGRVMHTSPEDPRFQGRLFFFGAVAAGLAAVLLNIIFRTFLIGW